MPDALLDHELDLTVIHEDEFQLPCTSYYCHEDLHKDTHPADWIVLVECGCTIYWCQDRMHIYETEDIHEGGLWCSDCDRESVYVANTIRLRKSM